MNRVIIEKDKLYQEYIINQKSMGQIAKENNIAIGSVYNYCKKYSIQTRKGHSEKTKLLLREMRIGKPSLRKGIKLSKEQREKISSAKKGKFLKPSKYGGHQKKRRDGYIFIYLPSHKHSTKDGYVMEHILVMEEYLGRYLLANEVVHHINKVRDDNRIENLKVMTKSEHARLHMIERYRGLKKKGEMTY